MKAFRLKHPVYFIMYMLQLKCTSDLHITRIDYEEITSYSTSCATEAAELAEFEIQMHMCCVQDQCQCCALAFTAYDSIHHVHMHVPVGWPSSGGCPVRPTQSQPLDTPTDQ